MTTVKVPDETWSTKDVDLDAEYYWASDGDGTLLAKDLGIPGKPTPLMARSRKYGSDLYMFTSDGKYYMWSLIKGDVWEYVKPTSLPEILNELSKPAGQSNVELKRLERSK